MKILTLDNLLISFMIEGRNVIKQTAVFKNNHNPLIVLKSGSGQFG